MSCQRTRRELQDVLDKTELSISREDCLKALRYVLDCCVEKMEIFNTKNSERMGWCRIMNDAIGKATTLMKDTDLDDLKLRLEKLERR